MEKQQFRKHRFDDVRIIDLKGKDLRDYLDDILSNKLDEFAKTRAPLPSKGGDLLTREQAAEILNITLPTLNTWTKTGKLKSCQIPGSRRVYYKAELLYQALHDNHIAVCK
jgi:excisionase family DNA binding protein